MSLGEEGAERGDSIHFTPTLTSRTCKGACKVKIRAILRVARRGSIHFAYLPSSLTIEGACEMERQSKDGKGGKMDRKGEAENPKVAAL